MILTYWVAVNKNDHACYNLRALTKKQLKAYINQEGNDPKNYYKPKKVTIEYASGFDLIVQTQGEGGISRFEIPSLEEDTQEEG